MGGRRQHCRMLAGVSRAGTVRTPGSGLSGGHGERGRGARVGGPVTLQTAGARRQPRLVMTCLARSALEISPNHPVVVKRRHAWRTRCHAPEGGKGYLTAGICGVKVTSWLSSWDLCCPRMSSMSISKAERGHLGAGTAAVSTYHLQPNVGG